ncbi:tyrosine-type recombinase/integrase [Cupriavidus phytorum]|uniref:tyrosine-type recombinase/integrase n=1 Tax=Cupriavidus phytorum TaxID=3024399 RepID=UPI000E2EFAF4
MNPEFGAFRRRHTVSSPPRSARRACHTLKKVLAFYLATPGTERSHYLARYSFRCAETFLGNPCINEITPKATRDYVSHELGRGLRTASIRNILGLLSAATSRYINEHGLAIRNPFLRVPIPREGHDRTRHQPVQSELLVAIRTACVLANDELRWILAIIIDTGARLNEIVGLGIRDIAVDAVVPHIVIIDRPWRRLKTARSKRLIPLAGGALWAAQQILATARTGQVHAFPHYVQHGKKVGKNVSSTLKEWLAMRGLDRGVHALRHVFVDRLRDVECPPDIRRALAGWADKTMEGRYGYGYSLETLKGWVDRIVGPVFCDLRSLASIERPKLTTYECVSRVLALVRELGRPRWQDLIGSTALHYADLRRGFDYGRRHGLIVVAHVRDVCYRDATRYVAIDRPIPPRLAMQVSAPSCDVEACATALLRQPFSMRNAECFPTQNWRENEYCCGRGWEAPIRQLKRNFRHRLIAADSIM